MITDNLPCYLRKSSVIMGTGHNEARGGMFVNRSRVRVAGVAVAAAALLTGLAMAVPAAAAPARLAAPARTAPAPFVIIMMENHGLHPVLNDRTGEAAYRAELRQPARGELHHPEHLR